MVSVKAFHGLNHIDRCAQLVDPGLSTLCVLQNCVRFFWDQRCEDERDLRFAIANLNLN
jgi:hypothetical protein